MSPLYFSFFLSFFSLRLVPAVGKTRSRQLLSDAYLVVCDSVLVLLWSQGSTPKTTAGPKDKGRRKS